MYGREVGFSGFGLWLWPLPPAEAFEFALEWPFGGIDLTIVELDGDVRYAFQAGALTSALLTEETSNGLTMTTRSRMTTEAAKTPHRTATGL